MKRTKFQHMCYRILYSDMRTINRLVLSFSGYMKNYRDNPNNTSRIKASKNKYVLKNRSNPEYKNRRITTQEKYIASEKGKKNFEEWYNNNRDRQLILKKIWGRNNPNHSLRSNDLDLALVFQSVRKKFNNTCQWQGCGLKHKATIIHVHHIFPVSEYPELKYEEKYMICYCQEHHAQFHAARGDGYSNLIRARTRTEGMELEKFLEITKED